MQRGVMCDRPAWLGCYSKGVTTRARHPPPTRACVLIRPSLPAVLLNPQPAITGTRPERSSRQPRSRLHVPRGHCRLFGQWADGHEAVAAILRWPSTERFECRKVHRTVFKRRDQGPWHRSFETYLILLWSYGFAGGDYPPCPLPRKACRRMFDLSAAHWPLR